MSLHVTVDMTLFEAYFRSAPIMMRRVMDEALHKLALYTRDLMFAEAPMRTGALRRSITVTKEGDAYVIKPTAPHTVYVERGTRPHEIVARRARALHFIWRGEPVFFRRVMHPGTRPNPFVARTRDHVERIAGDMVAMSVRAAL